MGFFVLSDTAVASGKFKLVFQAVALITVVSMILPVTVEFFSGNPLAPARVASIANNAWSIAKLGFGAIVGLLGGKAL